MRLTTPSKKNSPIKILGIDSSTLSVAYTCLRMIDNEPVPVDWGLIKLEKMKEMQGKLGLLASEFDILLESLVPDYIFIEMPIFVKNPATARKLSFIVGALMTVASQNNYPVVLVEPIKAKALLGYTNISSKFSTMAGAKLGKTEGKKLCDRLRKEQIQRTIKYNFPDFDVDDDNVADSCAIALYGVSELYGSINLEIGKSIAIPIDELKKMGLEL